MKSVTKPDASPNRSSRLEIKALALDDARELWPAFSNGDAYGVAQTWQWVSAWAEHVNPRVIVGAIFIDGRPALLLPLEIIRDRFCTVARYVGGTHANANFPVLRSGTGAVISPFEARALCAEIRRAFPQIDAIVLTRQMRELCAMRNPMLALDTVESPNLALSFAIRSDFETLIKDRSGARKLKKMRQQARRMDERGGWQCVVAADSASVDEILGAFFVMKRKRFDEFGLVDVFAEPEVKDFFRALFRQAAGSKTPLFQLDALRVGGEVFAVTGSSLRHQTSIAEFAAVRAHEPTLSPGDFLFHQMIKTACENKLAFFDFGVGDEPYKRAWCDIETHHADSVAGFGTRGRAYAAMFRAVSKIKLAFKRNEFLMDQLKKWRMRGAPKENAAD